MQPRIAITTAAFVLICTGVLSAQTAPSASRLGDGVGPYDTLSSANREIVSAIYEAQLGSPNDMASGKLLTRDEIAALRRKSDWGIAYRRLYERGLVKERNLDLAVRSYKDGAVAAGGLTVITTAGGEQMIFGARRSNNDPLPAARSGAKQQALTKTEQDQPAVVTNAGADVAEATSAAAGAALVTGRGNTQGVSGNQ